MIAWSSVTFLFVGAYAVLVVFAFWPKPGRIRDDERVPQPRVRRPTGRPFDWEADLVARFREGLDRLPTARKEQTR